MNFTAFQISRSKSIDNTVRIEVSGTKCCRAREPVGYPDLKIVFIDAAVEISVGRKVSGLRGQISGAGNSQPGIQVISIQLAVNDQVKSAVKDS